MQAALGRIALRKLPGWVATRRKHATLLTESLCHLPGLRITVPPQHINHAYYKYYMFVRSDMLKTGRDRDWIMSAINAEGIPCYSGSCSEIYLEKAFVKAGLSPSHCLPIARELGETSLLLLIHPTLLPEHLENTCNIVAEVMKKATGDKTH